MSAMLQIVLISSYIFKIYNLETWRGMGIGIGDLKIGHFYRTGFSFTEETWKTMLALGYHLSEELLLNAGVSLGLSRSE